MNEVYGNFTLQLNQSYRVLNFAKQWVAGYRCVFRTLSNFEDGLFNNKKFTSLSHRLFLQNISSQMFDRMSVDYLSCFAVVLRGIHGNVDICQTDYSI